MEEVEIIAATLNNTIARHAKTVQGLEVEIANLTAEIIRLQRQIESTNMKSLSEPFKESKNA